MGGHRVRGNGNLGEQTRNIGGFDAVEVEGGMDVVLIPGSTHSVRVSADENLLEYIRTEKEGTRLVVSTRRRYNLNPRAGMKIYVTAPELREIDVTGSGSITSQSRLVYNNRLTIDITGSGDVRLDVDAPEIHAEATGSGNTSLSGQTRSFRAAINGSGELRCFNLLSENTDIEISGSGSVQYRGNPSVKQRVSGSGSIEKVG